MCLIPSHIDVYILFYVFVYRIGLLPDLDRTASALHFLLLFNKFPTMKTKSLCLVFFFLALSSAAYSAIRVDGSAEDWTGNEGTVLEDVRGDAHPSGNDLVSVTVTNDATTLYLLLRYAIPHPATAPDLSVYFDSDGDPDTGFRYLGAGMDATWDFGEENGSWSFDSGRPFGRGEFLLRSAYDSDEGLVEMAFPLAMIRSAVGGNQLAFAIVDNGGRDRLPDLGTSAGLHLLEGPLRPHAPAGTLRRRHPEDLRILSWNVLRDGPFKTGLEENFGRVLSALRPDIICFQELYEASTLETLRFVDKWVPLPEADEFWRARKQFDCITVSRYPIESTLAVDNNLITEIDTSAVLGRRSWILNAHTPCCDNADGRLRETDNFMAALRKRKEQALADGELPFAIFLVGDMNTGGSRREMLTMSEGEIDASFIKGPSFAPDWDGSGLADLAPLETHRRRIGTWRSLNNRTNTSRLDYIFYSDSLVFPARSYVLNTRNVPASFLDAAGLGFADTDAADHLPLIGDFRSTQPGAPWGDSQIDASAWMTDSWIGSLRFLDFPFLYSPLWGWMYQAGTASATGAWFYLYDDGWIWLDRLVYPWYYDSKMQKWKVFPED